MLIVNVLHGKHRQNVVFDEAVKSITCESAKGATNSDSSHDEHG